MAKKADGTTYSIQTITNAMSGLQYFQRLENLLDITANYVCNNDPGIRLLFEAKFPPFTSMQRKGLTKIAATKKNNLDKAAVVCMSYAPN